MNSTDAITEMPAARLRVLVVAFAYLVGVYQGKLSALVEGGGAEVALLAPAKWRFREWSRPFTLKAHYPGIKLYPANIWLFNGRGGAFLYPLFTLLHALWEFKPNIIYVEQEVFSLSTFQLALFARLFNIPLAVFCWENVDRHLSFFRRWTRAYVLQTARLITPGNRGAAELLRRWGYEGALEILPQVGVDTDLFSPRCVDSAGRPFSIGFVGRLVYEKGVDLILTAAKILLERGHMLRVVVCGAGPEETALRAQAIHLGIARSIEWLGEYEYEAVPDAIALMDVLVLPSRTLPGKWREQFGHVLVEGMAMGIPAVGSSCGAIPDVIGMNRLIFPEGEAGKLADILQNLILNPDWRKEASNFGLQSVEDNYSHQRIAARLVALMEQVVRSSHESS